jgi:DNA-binding IclR family transcriptional regulator
MRSVQRILAVFESFTTERSSLTLQEIADRIGLPKSTSFRIVQSLEKEKYLVRLENQKYCLSFRFMRLAGLVGSTLDIRAIARPVMAELAARTDETVTLHTVSGRDRVCIDSVATGAPLRTVTAPGEHIRLLVGSPSEVLMAYMSPQELAPISAFISRTTKRGKAELLARLAMVREQGYAVSHGARVLGITGIAAPIKDVEEQVRYCLAVTGPSVRVRPRERELIKQVVKAAGDISLLYGAPA